MVIFSISNPAVGSSNCFENKQDQTADAIARANKRQGTAPADAASSPQP